MTGKPRAGLVNIVIKYITGGVDGGSYWHRGEVTVWLDEEGDWEKAGMMKDARTYHAASSIKMDDEAMAYCH